MQAELHLICHPHSQVQLALSYLLVKESGGLLFNIPATEIDQRQRNLHLLQLLASGTKVVYPLETCTKHARHLLRLLSARCNARLIVHIPEIDIPQIESEFPTPASMEFESPTESEGLNIVRYSLV